MQPIQNSLVGECVYSGGVTFSGSQRDLLTSSGHAGNSRPSGAVWAGINLVAEKGDEILLICAGSGDDQVGHCSVRICESRTGDLCPLVERRRQRSLEKPLLGSRKDKDGIVGIDGNRRYSAVVQIRGLECPGPRRAAGRRMPNADAHIFVSAGADIDLVARWHCAKAHVERANSERVGKYVESAAGRDDVIIERAPSCAAIAGKPDTTVIGTCIDATARRTRNNGCNAS